MNTFSTIRLKIAEREYSLRIAPKDEEILRRAGRLINECIRSKKEKIGIKDKQDLLAMVAFDSIVQSIRDDMKEEELCSRLNALDMMIEEKV